MKSGDKAQVYDHGYTQWHGPRVSGGWRFLAIARNEIRLVWKEKWFRRVAIVSFFPLGIFGVISLVQSRLQAVAELMDLWEQFFASQLIFAMLMVYYLGRNAIAEDRRVGAFSVYFSRPIGLAQYLLGKWSAIAMAVLLVILGPGLVLALLRWAVEPGVDGALCLRWVAALAGLSLMVALSQGAVILALSSMVQRGRTAGILWVIVYFVSSALGSGLASGTGMGQLRAIGFVESSTNLAGVALSGASWYADLGWQALGLGLWALVGAGVVLFQLRRWWGARP